MGAKFRQNKARDAKVRRQLRQLGWRVLLIWECEVKSVAAAGHRSKVPDRDYQLITAEVLE